MRPKSSSTRTQIILQRVPHLCAQKAVLSVSVIRIGLLREFLIANDHIDVSSSLVDRLTLFSCHLSRICIVNIVYLFYSTHCDAESVAC